MHKSSDAAQVETVKKLCTKDKCDIDPKAVFGTNIECPGKIVNICLHSFSFLFNLIYCSLLTPIGR